jgi:hypothetical protein
MKNETKTASQRRIEILDALAIARIAAKSNPNCGERKERVARLERAYAIATGKINATTGK